MGEMADFALEEVVDRMTGEIPCEPEGLEGHCGICPKCRGSGERYPSEPIACDVFAAPEHTPPEPTTEEQDDEKLA
jgi:hypothetical protein